MRKKFMIRHKHFNSSSENGDIHLKKALFVALNQVVLPNKHFDKIQSNVCRRTIKKKRFKNYLFLFVGWTKIMKDFLKA
jgi:hypothetical protein